MFENKTLRLTMERKITYIANSLRTFKETNKQIYQMGERETCRSDVWSPFDSMCFVLYLDIDASTVRLKQMSLGWASTRTNLWVDCKHMFCFGNISEY